MLSWLLLTFLCAVPFLYTEVNLGIVDALFESMSGVTTTGATTLSNLESLPKGILIWRAFLQWLGGIGIVVIALFILPFLRIGGMQLFHLEGDDPYDKCLPKMSSVIKKIFIICTWLDEIGSCSCLNVLPGSAWILLNRIRIPLTGALSRKSPF